LCLTDVWTVAAIGVVATDIGVGVLTDMNTNNFSAVIKALGFTVPGAP
jgi:hypothetical protein